MSRGSVLFIDTVHPKLQEELQLQGFTCVDGYTATKEQLMQDWNNHIGVVIRSRFKIDQEFLQAAKGLKFIARAGAGMENIDTAAADTFGVACLNAPEGNRNAVAEQALGMLLSMCNHLIRADRQVRDGLWLREENRGTEIDGKTIGIIGFGNTGQAFARKLQGFDVSVLVYDPYVNVEAENHRQVQQVGMEELFERCDVVSLHVPLTEETRHMTDANFFHSFKKPIRFINTSRGKVVNTAALVQAMETGHVLQCGLDVIEYESVSFENLDSKQMPEPMQYLLNSERAVLTPHIAGWTYESHLKISEVLADKIIRLFP
ncbi:MAG: NAD(P)-dependent oxidoreductase [Bacteroidota bacterium]|jgi:D-3-phosphoglycerate dehydrogenase